MSNTDLFDTNNYEFNKGSKRGAYLIHGFTSSTYELLDLAKFLSKNGFYVKLDNLPGHGTTVDDCNNTQYAEWIDHVLWPSGPCGTVFSKLNGNNLKDACYTGTGAHRLLRLARAALGLSLLSNALLYD